jgi:hypothetical protein
MSLATITVEGSGHECDVKLDTWLKDILPHTPGLVRKVAKRELILTAREFYERSCAWRVVVGPKNMIADKRRYVMSPYDAYADVVKVLSVEFEGMPLMPVERRPQIIDRMDQTSDIARYYWLEAPDYVRLEPVPQTSVASSLTFYVVLTPKQTVSHLPRIAATHHYDALLDGVLGRLFSHPAKPYSNPDLAQYRLTRFRAAIGSFAGMAKVGYSGAQAWNFPRFGK